MKKAWGGKSGPCNALVPPEDIWILVLCTLRYSFGRQTYMPQESVDFVIKYKAYLTAQQLEQIAHEIESEVAMYERRGETMGAACDHKLWKESIGYIGKLVADKEDEEPF